MVANCRRFQHVTCCVLLALRLSTNITESFLMPFKRDARMPMKKSSLFVGTLLVASVCYTASPAWAGFQWSPPAPVVIAPEAPVPSQAPVRPVTKSMSNDMAAEPLIIDGGPATQAPEVVAPVILGDTPTSAAMSASPAKPKLQPDLKIDGVNDNDAVGNGDLDLNMPSAASADKPQLLMTSPTGVTSTVTTSGSSLAAPAVSSSASGPAVLGFANHVPLTVALRQILPPSYSFSIDQDVDMGVAVSFKGGKPWRQTLAETLAPVGLGMHEQAQMVVISRLDSVASIIKPTEPLTSFVAPSAAATPVTVQSAVQPSSVAAPAPYMQTPPPSAVPTAPLESAAVAVPLDQPTRAVSKNEIAVPETWNADRGDSLRKVLTTWSKRSHVEVEWLAEYDYPLQASVNFVGTYEAAVRALLVGFEDAHPQPVAQLHTNPTMGQRVLVVRARGNSNKD